MSSTNSDFSEFVRKLKEKLNIIEVMSPYIVLKKRGKSYIGLCPFHGERTPSFNVNEDKGQYYCFGCRKHGDAISFLQDIKGISFRDAVLELAEKAGLSGKDIPKDMSFAVDPEAQKRRAQAKLGFKLNEFAASFFHQKLMNDRDGKAMVYLKNRGFSRELIYEYLIGFSSPSWDDLALFLEEKKAPLDTAVELGLIKNRDKDGSGTNKGHYDVFRNRVIFPIRNADGEVIGFGGRTLDSEEKTKYLNSPETPLFKKRTVLYGIDKARRFIRDKDEAIIVEGYVDCIFMQTNGFENTVATLGTALSIDHALTLKKHTKNIIMLYDGDNAGFKAAEETLGLFLAEGMSVKMALMPEKTDPDEFIIRNGRGAMEEVLNNAESLVDRFISSHLSEAGTSIDSKLKVLKPILEVLKYLDGVELDVRVKNIALRLGGIEESSIYKSLNEIKGANKVKPLVNVNSQNKVVQNSAAQNSKDQSKKAFLKIFELGVKHRDFGRFILTQHWVKDVLGDWFWSALEVLVVEGKGIADVEALAGPPKSEEVKALMMQIEFEKDDSKNSSSQEKAEFFGALELIAKYYKDKVEATFAKQISEAEKTGNSVDLERIQNEQVQFLLNISHIRRTLTDAKRQR